MCQIYTARALLFYTQCTMKTRIELYNEWCDAALSVLERYDIYTREQILKSRNMDCLEYRAVLVSVLMSKGLSDARIQSVTGLSIQQIYRMKRYALDLSRDAESVYGVILPIVRQCVDTVV